ncbi:MAG: glycosyltransferase family 4 protein [Terriglobales bacterium]
MRVGIDAHTLGSKSSGNESYYLELLQELAKAESNGNEYVVYYTLEKAVTKIPVATHLRPKRIWPPNPYIRIPISFPSEFRREKLDVFHGQFIIPPFCNCRSVTTIPDILFETYPQFFTPWENFQFRTLIRWSAMRADHIITVSQASKTDIVSKYKIAPEKVSIIDEAPRDEFRVMDRGKCKEIIARKYGIAESFILYVGRINPRKNLLRLIEAFSILRRKGTEQKLVIVGKQDWQADKVLDRVKALALEANVVCTGYVDGEDVPVFYNAADVFVFPSICEGFGLPLVEAMACGCPIVTSYGSSLEEVSGSAAILADPWSVESLANAIGSVVGDTTLRQSLRAKGLKRVAEFNAARNAQNTVDIYTRLAGS